MKNKIKYILLHAAKLPILLLYCCFFTVQVFSFNSDASTKNATQFTFWYHSDGLIKTNASLHIEKTINSKQNNVNIRLNKRFQPEKAICCNTFFIKTPGYRLLKKSQLVFRNDAASLNAFTVHLLRGPPAVVA